MIIMAAVIVGFGAVFVAAVKLHQGIDNIESRLRVLTGGYRDAGLLISARQRFRRRQQNVEQAVDISTAGVQTAHRTIAGWFGANRDGGQGVYDRVRTINRNLGRTLSNLFAPGPSRHSDSLEHWRSTDDPDRRNEHDDDPDHRRD